MTALPWPGPAVVLMKQPDGSVMAFPMLIDQLDFAHGRGGPTGLTMRGVMGDGRAWDPSAPVPFEQQAIEQMPPQIGEIR